MTDPLKYFETHFLFDKSEIERFSSGNKYTAIMLKNGNIGVCSNLGNIVSKRLPEQIDLENLYHRIIYQAYLNAKLNYQNEYQINDIFDKIEFEEYSNILMIGYFKSLVNKFDKKGIKLEISDLKADSERFVNPENQKIEIQKSDAIILTSTSVFNKSFSEIIENSKKSDIFLLGPSGIMHPYFLEIKNIKLVFGSIFNKFDNEVLNIIENDGGTRSFMHLMKKVYLI